MIRLRNIIELISILIIVFFLKQKTEINDNDLLILILLILFIFIIYDYASGNKNCPKIEQFNNNEPCNIKDLEKMFDNYNLQKKEKFKLNKIEKYESRQNKENQISDIIRENIQSENIQSENIQSENIQSEQLYSVEPEYIQSENIQSENIQSEYIQSENIQSENSNTPTYKNIETNYDSVVSNNIIKKKTNCNKWGDLVDNRMTDSYAVFPSIFINSPNLSYPNYDTDKSCDLIDTTNVLPQEHSNKV